MFTRLMQLLRFTPPGTVLASQQIPNTRDGGYHRQLTDIYWPTGADKGLTFLHGGAGNGRQAARDLGALVGASPTVSGTDWTDLATYKTMLAVPTGCACVGEEGNPYNPDKIDTRSILFKDGIRGWSNRQMSSGADDVQFLKDLVKFMRNLAKLPEMPVAISGHSMGGIMVQRMWAEYPDLFSHHIAFAGPPAGYYITNPVLPVTIKPKLEIVGDKDEGVGVWSNGTSHFYEDTLLQQRAIECNLQNPPLLVSFWNQLRRTAEALGVLPTFEAGIESKWTMHFGKLVTRLIPNAPHDLTDLQTIIGKRHLETIGEFVKNT